ncbi:MAG: UDP-N-acetylmuramoyl-L-alanine--D-glutamate ligase [Alphaproteobacteria bacterium]|nr:UDP-N-acetylmuramoyl-L-alanine--D-glutamate ligase [Alphaproteobacteria bacterium]
MKAGDLEGKKIAIWGLGREGKAAAEFLRARFPELRLTFIDESTSPDKSILAAGDVFAADIAASVDEADIIVKSPGVSLYHPALQNARGKLTSLLNLWLAEPHAFKTVGVTGTKGKSTTASLLAHTLNGLGKKAVLLGNIGVPVTQNQNIDADFAPPDFAVVEISSYQAATLAEDFDIGIVTALYPEHLDWHRYLAAYYRDKLQLLAHSQTKIIGEQAFAIARENDIAVAGTHLFGETTGLHAEGTHIFDGVEDLGAPDNAYLARAHNLANVCAVLAVIKQLGLDPHAALRKMEDFRGLPHRQEEIGTRDGILFVDDSISTTPQSAIAAMEAYAGRAVTLLAGGFDRGIDYQPLVDYILAHKIHQVICMGPSGARIHAALRDAHAQNVRDAENLQVAVVDARRLTPVGGVILLSPAAPSYGAFKNFEERGRAFRDFAGFNPS